MTKDFRSYTSGCKIVRKKKRCAVLFMYLFCTSHQATCGYKEVKGAHLKAAFFGFLKEAIDLLNDVN